MKKLYIYLILMFLCSQVFGQHSIARVWNEATLLAIRNDFARPPVHARNLYHISLAMYEAWAIFDSTSQLVIYTKNPLLTACEFNGIATPQNIDSARIKAISFAAYRIIEARFIKSPKYLTTLTEIKKIMTGLGYDYLNVSTDYQSGDPAALGNAIAECILTYGRADGSNELNNYAIQKYVPINPPLYFDSSIQIKMVDPNRWQPLFVKAAVDQNGNPIPPLQRFQGPEWGKVKPFALTNPKKYFRDSNEYTVYHDPGPFPKLDTLDASNLGSIEFKWNMELVIAWSAHLSPLDQVNWDISPNGLGNLPLNLPSTFDEFKASYDFDNGRSLGPGYPLNPKTDLPYTPQIVRRGDFSRVLAQFWADGPNTETPPGHWFSLLNSNVSDKMPEKKFGGKGKLISNLEWDIKAYLTLGAAMHDVAISAWGIKGWYDGVRPVSAIRYMATLGQCSDSTKPRYHPGGLTLIPGLIEIIEATDSLALLDSNNIGKIKIKAWRGHKVVLDYVNDLAGVGWILGERWLPYQEVTFVTPPFAGYISGHSTYSRAAAEVLTYLTGDRFFPGGLGTYTVQAFRKLIKFEKTPQYDITLQWATYQDAANQSSLSRIWGGIHPPMDDIPGRRIAREVAKDVFEKTRELFYNDNDLDGYYSHEDCDDENPKVNPGAKEILDGIDNDCNGQIDDITIVYFTDNSITLYPNPVFGKEIIISNLPKGKYVITFLDIHSRICGTQKIDVEFSDKTSIDVSHLSTGMYSVLFRNNEKEYYARILVSR